MTPDRTELMQEVAELLRMLSRLPPDKQEEFLYMLKGASLVAEKCA